MSPALRTVVLLTLSNVFMTFAWYGHLRTLGHRAWWVAALAETERAAAGAPVETAAAGPGAVGRN